MSNRIYNTDKVENKIGLPGQIKYDKIDVFIDQNNQNNLWGIVYYTEYKKNKPIVKEQIIDFVNFKEMVYFIKTNFDGYELNNNVEYRNRHIFFHNIDYINVDYYLYEGKPNLNYIELNYKEYVNNGIHNMKKNFSKEYENMFLHHIKVSKHLVENSTTNVNVMNIIDVNAKPEKNIREKERESLKIHLPLDARIKKRQMEKEIAETRKKKRIKNLKIVVSSVTLGTILIGGGYKLYKDSSTYKREFITQNNPAITMRDINIHINKDRANEIVDSLVNNNYKDISGDILKFVLEYIKEVENSNYDQNNSTSFLNYTEYFSSKLLENNMDIRTQLVADQVLSKIENLYNNSFKIIDNHLFVNKEGLNKYIDYVASLTFMYDTVVDRRDSGQVSMNTQSIASKYAKKNEIETYNKFPSILKYIILNQLKTALNHTDYRVTDRPSYYFGGLDKGDLIRVINDKMDIIVDNLRSDCSQKSM